MDSTMAERRSVDSKTVSIEVRRRSNDSVEHSIDAEDRSNDFELARNEVVERSDLSGARDNQMESAHDGRASAVSGLGTQRFSTGRGGNLDRIETIAARTSVSVAGARSPPR
jgi:hypothetical protein